MTEPIDRHAALRLCIEGDGHDDERFTEGYNFAVCEIREGLKGLTTVETKPVRHGKWIEETEPDENGNVITMCNQCYHTDEHCKNMKIPYCWYCGADMREDDGV